MKKILTFIFLSVIACFVITAETKADYIQKAYMAGLSYKKSLAYAELKLEAATDADTSGDSGEKATSEAQLQKKAEKISAYEAKIAAGEEKAALYTQNFPEKAAAKQEKRLAKLEMNNKRYAAVQAYNQYVYNNEKTADIPINPKTGFPEILSHPFVVFDEGVTFDMITRLQKQDSYNRSNFVWQDYLIGAYFDVTTVNMKPINSMARISVYYPFYHTFDGMRQYAKQTILYAFDIYAGPVIHANMWNYVKLNFSLGPHYMYQLSDEYHLNYLGLGILAGAELPVARRWTIVNNGTFTVDYANLGSNQRMCPFDYSWSYQVSLGVRYSKKKLNKYAYIHHLDKKAENLPDEESDIPSDEN